MIHHILSQCGRPTLFGGNIGGSLLPQLDAVTPETFIVLELSSAMLHWLGGWSPHVAVVTNFAANHLDWHASVEHYRSSKQNILATQQSGDHAVLGADIDCWTIRQGVHRHVMSPLNRIAGLAIPGEHNQQNAAMAVHAARLLDPSISQDLAISHARTFSGLPHRLQFITEVKGCRCYNDSKSTTPESAILAVRAFEADGPGKIHLIAGGYDKGSDLTPIAALASRIGGLYTIGDTGPRIASAAGERSNVFRCGTLQAAVDLAMAQMKEGDLLLLSTGCASWDQFENYEKRGEAFVQLVKSRA
jgi:UDP-N-acetylmuramoylalanine--D-glutamate ligase